MHCVTLPAACTSPHGHICRRGTAFEVPPSMAIPSRLLSASAHAAAITGVRLVGGPNADAGRVEVQVGGHWGTVLSNGFTGNPNAAQVRATAASCHSNLACRPAAGSSCLDPPRSTVGRLPPAAASTGCVPPAGQEGRRRARRWILRAWHFRHDCRLDQLSHRPGDVTERLHGNPQLRL